MFGALFGDILGSAHEFEEVKYADPAKISLFREEAKITDDSSLTLAVADWLVHDIDTNLYDDQLLRNSLAERFVKWTRWRTDQSEEVYFGCNYTQWFYRAELIQDYTPINSYGNGSGMRVSPVGWYFDSLEETLRFAKISSDVTHNHPEGEKGAMCIATAIYLARTGHNKEEILQFLIRAFGYEDLGNSVATLRENCTWSCSCQDTIPMAVVAFLASTDYESAIRNAISYGGDSDTIACMAGAIAEAFYQKEIPTNIVGFCKERIPEEAMKICREFSARSDSYRQKIFNSMPDLFQNTGTM